MSSLLRTSLFRKTGASDTNNNKTPSKRLSFWHRPEKKELEAISEVDSSKLEVVKVPSTTPLSEFVLVISDKDYTPSIKALIFGGPSSTKINKAFSEEHSGAILELYNVNTSKKADFKKRFINNKPEYFEKDVLYRLNPRNKKYLRASRYCQVIEAEKFLEMLLLMGDAGADYLKLDESLHKMVEDSNTVGGSMNTPADVLPVEVGLAVDVTRGYKVKRNQDESMEIQFAEPVFKRHNALTRRWYFDHGLQHPEIQEIVPKIIEQGSRIGDFTIKFARSSEKSNLRKLQVKLCDCLGVVTSVEHDEKKEFEYTIKVTLLDNSKFTGLNIWSPHAATITGAQRKLAELASLRYSHFTDRSCYREDIIGLKNGQAVPYDELLQKFEGTWYEWLIRQASTNVLTIPFVFIGLKNAGKTSVQFTWESIIRKTPYTFIEDGNRIWKKMSSQPRNEYETFMTEVKFDINAMIKESPRAIDDTMYSNLNDKNAVRLLIHDTIAIGSDLNTDISETPFPFGLRMLVIDTMDIIKAVDLVKQKPIENSPDVTIQAAITRMESLYSILGKELGKKRGNLLRYPPMCVLLAKCNQVAITEVILAQCVDFVNKFMKITYVFPMPTLVPPSTDICKIYKEDRDNSHEKLLTYSKTWYEVANESVETMDKMINAVVHNEFQAWIDLKKPSSNK